MEEEIFKFIFAAKKIIEYSVIELVCLSVEAVIAELNEHERRNW